MPSSSSARRSAVVATAAVAAALLTGGCRVDVQVGLRSDADGTGEVRISAALDEAAVEQLVGRAAGDPGDVDPAKRIRVDDLREAGWTIEGPTVRPDGGMDVVVRQRFDDAAEARRLVAEVAGEPGPFRGIRLAQERGFFRTTTRFRGTVDLAAGLGAFTDPELREALQSTDEAPLGLTGAQLERRFGAAMDRLFGLRVAVRLPGAVEANAPTVTENGAVWTPKLGEQVVLEAESRRWNVRNLVALSLAAASALGLVIVGLRRRSQADPVDDAATPAAPFDQDDAPADDAGEEQRQPPAG